MMNMITAMIRRTIPTQSRNCSDCTIPPVMSNTTATIAITTSKMFTVLTFPS